MTEEEALRIMKNGDKIMVTDNLIMIYYQSKFYHFYKDEDVVFIYALLNESYVDTEYNVWVTCEFERKIDFNENSSN